MLGGMEGGRRKSAKPSERWWKREMVRKKRQWSDGKRARRMKKENVAERKATVGRTRGRRGTWGRRRHVLEER